MNEINIDALADRRPPGCETRIRRAGRPGEPNPALLNWLAAQFLRVEAAFEGLSLNALHSPEQSLSILTVAPAPPSSPDAKKWVVLGAMPIFDADLYIAGYPSMSMSNARVVVGLIGDGGVKWVVIDGSQTTFAEPDGRRYAVVSRDSAMTTAALIEQLRIVG